MMTTKWHEIPEAPNKKFGIGHLYLLDFKNPNICISKIAKDLGPIFTIDILGEKEIIVQGHEVAKEVCDITRFDKMIFTDLQHVRAFTGDGLFTSRTDEPNWKKAHNILLPTFTKQAMKDYHEMMVDIAEQLVNKWTRLNKGEVLNVPDDMTRLTIDTIGLCGFNYRFNSFYSETLSSFIQSMVRALNESMLKTMRPKFIDKFMHKNRQQLEKDIQVMFELTDQIIAQRKRDGNRGELDLLARMLEIKDPDTGETLDDENIRYQMITFLIAGHETTSGLLSFTIYYLLKNPDVLQKAYEEVARVVQGDIPTYEEVTQLKYVRMVLNESLRLWPTAPAIVVYAKEDTTVGGKYLIEKGQGVMISLMDLHRDKEAWGEDAEEFNPERFRDSSKVPHHAYKPFGNGQRACIGMQFALHEATLVIAMILQRFELVDEANYKLKIQQTLTIKPENFTMKVVPRTTKEGLRQQTASVTKTAPSVQVNGHGTPLLVLYGSDLGSSKTLAETIANEGKQYGFTTNFAPLNDYEAGLPQDGAVIIIAASYNGMPARNAATFVKALGGMKTNGHYAVFGCGDRNWSNTYQKVPRFIDEKLAKAGATKILPIGEGDMSDDFEKQAQEWKEKLWQKLQKQFDLSLEKQETENFTVEFVDEEVTPLQIQYEATKVPVLTNHELMRSERSTRRIVLQLPEHITYQEGDHLGVIPQNSKALIERVLKCFKLNSFDKIDIHHPQMTHLPTNQVISLYELLQSSVEIQAPATRKQIQVLAEYNLCPPHKKALEKYLEDEVYQEEILSKNISMLTLLEEYPSSDITFEKFLQLLPPLKPRYYSISSAPTVDNTVSITVGVVNEPAWSGKGNYEGIASNYLANCAVGEKVAVFVQPAPTFKLPKEDVPIVMIGPGTGLAPFMGFLQARKMRNMTAPALLYYGCRTKDEHLYAEEIQQYDVEMHTAYSREGEQQYVQDIIDFPHVIEILQRGGHLYICGDGRAMAPNVEAKLKESYGENAETWLQHLQEEGRYAKDVWA